MSEGKRYRMTVSKTVRSVATAEINARDRDEAELKILNLTKEDPTWVRWTETGTRTEGLDSAEEVRK